MHKPLPASANFSKTFHISANIWEEVFSKREEATRNHFAVVEGASAGFEKTWLYLQMNWKILHPAGFKMTIIYYEKGDR